MSANTSLPSRPLIPQINTRAFGDLGPSNPPVPVQMPGKNVSHNLFIEPQDGRVLEHVTIQNQMQRDPEIFLSKQFPHLGRITKVHMVNFFSFTVATAVQQQL
ncbi:unnamed protein product [Cuscuta epithymum]|uniref:Uncharacterized protein n=1 Tax=Cuscuta epithymum TaxID=186058 RepID=A0AAV0D4J0_9ASTE|nr:unnamed protein product [Cuscuta epithymum]